MNKIISALLVFVILATVLILGMVYIQDILGETIIDEFNNTAEKLIANDNPYKDDVLSIAGVYDSAKINYDWIFLLMWSILEITIVSTAILSAVFDKYTFFSYLLFGSLFFLFAFSFVMDINNWLYQELLIDVFSADITYMPLYNFFMANQLAIVLLNFVGVLLINQMFGGKGKGGPAITNN